MGADLYFDFFAVNHQCFCLQIRLPHLLGVALRKADVMTVLLAFFIKIQPLHNSADYFTGVKR